MLQRNHKVMRNTSARTIRFGIGLFSMAMLAGPGLVAQNQPSIPQPSPVIQPPQQQSDSPHGWRRADDPPPQPPQTGTAKPTGTNTPAEPPYQPEPRDQY